MGQSLPDGTSDVKSLLGAVFENAAQAPVRCAVIVMKFFASFSVMCGGKGGTFGSV